MKKCFTMLAVLMMAATVFALEDYSQWSKYKVVTINTTSGGANVGNSVTNFPLLVRLTSAQSDVFSQSMPNGADIRFAAANGITHLAYNRERWDSAGQVAEFWVLVPAVAGNASTDIRMYWGKSGSGDSADNASGYTGAKVFDTTSGHLGVWHMGNATGTTGRPNAVPGGNLATPAASTANLGTGFTPITGVIGKADTLRNLANSSTVANEDHFNLGSGYVFTAGQSTISMWLLISSPFANTSYVHFITFGNGNLNDNLWMGRIGSTNNFSSRSATTAEGTSRVVTDGLLPLATWANFTITSHGTNGEDRTFYKNGVVIGDYTSTNALDDINPVVRTLCYIGRSLWGDRNFRGSVDEVRVANTSRSADWVKLDYENQKPGASCVSLGTTQVPAPAAPSNLTYLSNPAVYTVGTAIPNNTPTVTGTVVSFGVSPALPAGLILNTTSGVISGTPTAATAAANYTVTATNGGGSTTVAVSITVNAALAPPSNLTYSSNPAVYTVGAAITNNTPTVTGAVASFGVSPALPAGLSLNTSTGVISGTPTAATAAANYTVTATNAAGSVTAAVGITVNAALAPPSNLTYSSNPAVYTVGAAITNNTPTVTGAVASYGVSPALPAGLSLNTSTGVISGTPAAATAAANYTVTATNAAGSVTAGVSITVNAALAPPSNLTYSSNPAVYTVGAAITNNTPTVTGAVASFGVSPALPTGLSLNTSSGVISGTPTAATAVANYTVTATNAAGSTTVVVSVTVNAALAPPTNLTYSSNPAVYTVGAAITNNTPTVTGAVANYGVSPALPAGLSLNTSTGVISGTPTTATAAAYYIMTATNAAGSTTVAVSVTVNSALAPPSGLSYSVPTAIYKRDSVIAPNTPSVTGTVAGYTVSPSLPSGLTLNSTNGFITGTPTVVSAAASYTITATNASGSTTATVSITVNDASTALFRTANFTNAFVFKFSRGAGSVAFPLPATGVERVRLVLTDMRGRILWAQTSHLGTGGRELSWDGTVSNGGGKAPAGVYLVRVTLLDNGMKQLGVLERTVTYAP